MKSPLQVASISDIHLGHPNTPTTAILERLYQAFPDTEETGKLDLILIGGDVFDRALHLYDPNVREIRLWINSFLRMCQRRDIVVIVVEGTPSHDWKQSRIFTIDNKLSKIGCDVRYIDTLKIETVDSLGVRVLCVPDEWRPDTDDTWVEVTELLTQQPDGKVDFTVVHGAFDFQLPTHVKVPTHKPERFLDITTQLVFGAHIHKPTVHEERLLVNGSFDRLAHGEEEDKGHWRVTIKDGECVSKTFVVNAGAKVYQTIDCKGLGAEKALEKLSAVSALPDHSAVRIRALKNDAILSSMDVLKEKYPLLEWSTKVTDGTDTQKNLLTDLRSMFHEINITSKNVEELLLPKLQALTDDPQVVDRCVGYLKELIP